MNNIFNHIYSNIFKLFGIEVLTNDGWKEIESINITDPVELYEVQTSTNSLVCTEKHSIIDENGNQINAIDSNGKNIQTKDGVQKVINVVKLDKKSRTYDLTLKGDTKTYYANGILSHNCVILDEFAFLQKSIADKLFTSMYPVISSSKNGKFIIVSTPNGTDNLYYDIWQQANAKDVGKNLEGWKPFEMFWWQVPGHDEAWKQRQIAAIGKERFAQEFDNQFLANSTIKKLIPDDIISSYKMKLSEYKSLGITSKKQRIVSENDKQLYEFDMWHEFQIGHTYVASGDIAEGVGADASVLYIWDVTDLSNILMCAKFSSNSVSLVQFAFIARQMLALYNDPYLFAERNGVSAGMLDSLRITYGYQNIAVENKKNEPGIYSHVTVKCKACLWAREMMTTQGFGFTIYDKELIDEMNIFVKKDTKSLLNVYQALPGPNSHDDHMMTFIWMCYSLCNDRIDNYFIVAQTFTTELGQIYAQYLQPQNDVTVDEWNRINNDQMYKDFIEFKNEVANRLKSIQKNGIDEDENDPFVNNSRLQHTDMYFGDQDNDSWNSTPFGWNMNQRQNTQKQIIQMNQNATLPCFAIS